MAVTNPRPEPHWLTSFRKIENTLHRGDGKACPVPYPASAPPFIVISYLHSDPASAHTYIYFETAEATLEYMVKTMRDRHPLSRHLYEYSPVSSNFEFKDLLFCGLQLGYTPADVPRSTLRTRRAHSIVKNSRALYMTDAEYDRLKRFFTLTRLEEGYITFYDTDSIDRAADAIYSTAQNATSFVNLYDLDVSDKPIPVRIGFTYTDLAGIEHTYIEPD